MGLCFRIVLRQSPSLGSSPVYADVSGRTLEWLLLVAFILICLTFPLPTQEVVTH